MGRDPLLDRISAKRTTCLNEVQKQQQKLARVEKLEQRVAELEQMNQSMQAALAKLLATDERVAMR
jgi:cell division septum initiation protein DivIVA